MAVGAEPAKQAAAPAETLTRTVRLQQAWQLIRAVAPEIFDLEHPPPLAIGAHLELVARGVDLTKRELTQFFRWWVARPAYLRALTAGQLRRHLDGSPAGVPTPAQRQRAADQRAARERGR